MNKNQRRRLSRWGVFTTVNTLVSQASKESRVEVIKGLDSHEMTQQQREFNNAIAQGLVDVSEGRTVAVGDVRKRLGLAE